MIEKLELLTLAKARGVPVATLEKDYVLGWFLAAIQKHSNLLENWIFKGGTCLKKCYLENYRFSEDLDFSLIDASQLNKVTVKDSMFSIAEWLYEEVDLEVPVEKIKIDEYKNSRDKICIQVSVRFQGPLRPKSKACWPKVKFDLTADEKIVEVPESRLVFHSYSDKPSQAIYVNAYPIEELFAEKLRALSERCRPRDLYDVVMLFQNKEQFNLSSVSCLNILEKKCYFKSIDVPNFTMIKNHSQKQILDLQWRNMLQHQITDLPPWENFWKELPLVFQWLVTSP